jgi:hypothetical protein
MVKRLTATKELLHMSVMGVQFVAGIRFLMGMFDSDETVRNVWESISGTFGQMGGAYSGSSGVLGTSSSGPPGALLLVLGFMCFGYVLFTALPGTAAKMEKGRSLFIDD